MGEGSGVAVNCGVGHTHTRGLDLAWLWLWCRLAAVVPIGPLAWEPPYTMGAAPKRPKKKREKRAWVPTDEPELLSGLWTCLPPDFCEDRKMHFDVLKSPMNGAFWDFSAKSIHQVIQIYCGFSANV